MESRVIDRLEELERRSGPLPVSLKFYRRLVTIQAQARARIVSPGIHLTREAVKSRLIGGSPLLSFDDLSIDWALLEDLFEKFIALFAEHARDFGVAPESLKGLSSQPGVVKEAVRAWYEGKQLPAVMTGSGVSQALLETIIQATLKPFLTSYSEILVGLIEQEWWRRGYCPVCGGHPDFSFLEKERGARWLLCSRCDAKWLFQRLECPFCGNQNQKKLAFYTDDGQYRLYVCEQCHHYLKAIDLRKKEEEVLLPLERVLTLDIDEQAQQEGYSPVTGGGVVEGTKSES